MKEEMAVAISPMNIHLKEFSTVSTEGYDKEEVDSFLDAVADELEKLANKNKELEEAVTRMDRKVSQFDEMQKTLETALMNAQKSAGNILQEARSQAAAIIKGHRTAAIASSTTWSGRRRISSPLSPPSAIRSCSRYRPCANSPEEPEPAHRIRGVHHEADLAAAAESAGVDERSFRRRRWRRKSPPRWTRKPPVRARGRRPEKPRLRPSPRRKISTSGSKVT